MKTKIRLITVLLPLILLSTGCSNDTKETDIPVSPTFSVVEATSGIVTSVPDVTASLTPETKPQATKAAETKPDNVVSFINPTPTEIPDITASVIPSPELVDTPIVTQAVTSTPLPTAASIEDSEDEGYMGDVELNNEQCPLVTYDNLSYALLKDNTAVVLYTFFTDDTLSKYNVRDTILYGGISYTVTAIADDAFNCFLNATKITLPNTIKTIGINAFANCEELTSINLSSSLETIGEAAFSSCWSLTDITLPDSVVELGNSAFYDCTGLKTVILSSSLNAIPDECFSGCERLSSIAIPESITYIGSESFWYCESLRELNLPASVNVIGDRAFYDCLALTYLRLPENMASISDDAFDYCDSLKTLYVPSNKVKKYTSLFEGYEFAVEGY